MDSYSKASKALGLVTCLLVCNACLYLSHAASSNSINSGPRIEIKPNTPQVFFEAQTANKVLTCSALGDKPGMFNQLRWSGPNRMDNWEELNKRHRIKETHRRGYAIELEFQRPTPDDSGTYYCQGIYQSSDVFNASVEVKVYNPMKIENCPDRQFVVEGSGNQKITCRVTGDSLTMGFSKDGSDPTNSRYKWDNEDSILILGSADKSDGGIYKLEITSDLTGNRETREIQVEVHSKPEFSQNATNEYMEVEGEQVELKCGAFGNPQPLIHWLDPKRRNSSSLGGYFVNPERGTLLISRLNRNDDNGDFTCIAENTVGQVSKKIKLIAMQRPNIVAFVDKTFEEGTDAILECRATGFPKPTISIRRHGLNQSPNQIGEILDTADDVEGGSAPGFVHRIKFRADRSQFGLHYCNATNKAGSAEMSNLLKIKHKPDLSLTPPEQYVRLGRNVSVTCHIRAYPDPIVSWLNENRQKIIYAQTDIKKSPDGQTHIITMSPPINLQTNIAKYICVAENTMGEPVETHIRIRYMSPPGLVNAQVQGSTPTTVKLHISVMNDGGDRIRSFRYTAEGRTLDMANPFINYPVDRQNETLIEASPSVSDYVIRNLYPYYRYRISIRAVNDVGVGDFTEITADTHKPTQPEPPTVIKPNVGLPSQFGFISEYRNGYLLKWSPPDLDNGDSVTKYLIKYFKISPEQSELDLESGGVYMIEQTNERPLHAEVGPLDVNQHYKILIQARNKYGDSEPASIIISTRADRPLMPSIGPQALSWLTEPSTSLLIALLVAAIFCLIVIDIIFCVCFQIGVSFFIKSCCCPAKSTEVIREKTYT